MVLKWLKHIIKGFVVICCIALIWRVLFAGSEATLDELIPTTALSQVYKDKGDIEILTNEIADEISESGYFSAYSFFYSPETKEVQVTVRYNNSTLDALHDFDFYLYTVDTSVAPVDTEIATGESNNTVEDGVRLHNGYPMSEILEPVAEYTQTDEILFYNYEKLVFRGVEVKEGTNIIISLCAAGDKDDEKAVITAHFAEQPLEKYELSDDECEALAAFKR